MKKIATIAVTALACLGLALPLWAQETVNVAGRWEMTDQTPRGTQKSTFTFEQEGNVLTGTVEGRMGSTPIKSGSVDGDVITFTVVLGGRGNRSMEMTYTGTLEGDTITGSGTTPRGDRRFTMKRVEG